MKRQLPTTLVSLFSFLSIVAGCTISTEPGAGGSSSSSSSSSGSLGSDAGAVGTTGCNLGEPNENRDQTTAVLLDTAYTSLCLAGREDHDWYQLTAPNDNAGGYVKVVVSNVVGTSVQTKAYVQSSNREIMTAYSAVEGETLTTYFAVAPGAKYNVVVDQFSGDNSATYDVRFDYVKIVDTFEPNDTRDAAKVITAGATVEAHLMHLAGPVAADEDIDDWYKVDLAAGLASVRIESVPTDVSVSYELRSAAGTQVDTAYKAVGGESLIETDIAIATAGTYYVRVGAFNRPDNAGKGNVPDAFTRKYTLKIANQ